ncbi:hypothetical protein LQ318_01300 [Aliifodinibius salicampi]|uniref:Aminopeptidase N-like N-terminal domain-containing protein n=1 Tax=Fodinibius salicampi TaxID=1920655 RepID=A0ABT3PUK9_9BACT|nr:hypothetical protein [Fodinibius salicampi]MCW9711526.1 hypothetical protein [Fodinibius salicampi]
MNRTEYPATLTCDYICVFCALIFLLMMCPAGLTAQSFDYEEHPRLDFELMNLELDLGIQPQNLRFEGAANYQLEANIDGADTLIVHTAHLDVRSTTVDGNNVEFQLQNDSLFIPVSDSAEYGESFEVRIRYSGDSQFGLLKNGNGTVWTSYLPQAQRHWVPIIENPHVTLQTTFNISVPSDYQVWATGRKTGENEVNESTIQYNFSSETEIPATDLAFAIGQLESTSTTYGIKRINLAIEEGLTDEIVVQELLQTAYDELQAVEEGMQSEFPFERLNVIVLEDHNWETRSWGASTIFLYENAGDIKQQLLRGIIGQWIGSRQRAAQWEDGDIITLYQTIAYESLNDSLSIFEVKDRPDKGEQSLYDVYSPEYWNGWQNQWERWQGGSWGAVVAGLYPNLLNQMLPVISWKDFANHWYQQSGQPMFDAPNIVTKTGKNSSRDSVSVADTVVYEVNYQTGGAGQNLRLTFEADGREVFDEIVTLQAHRVYENGSESDEVSFTGARDSVDISISADMRTLRLEVPDGIPLKLREHKPVSFLLYELRNSETLEQRVQAAGNLGTHTENPDLQLAITDMLESGVDPRVHAALLTSLAEITQGAAGTEQMFLNALDYEYPLIQKAALGALKYYPDNAEILKAVKSMTANTDDPSLFRQGVAVMSDIAGEKEMQQFFTEIVQQDTVGHRSLAAINQLLKMGQTDLLSEMDQFLENSYDYSVRAEAFEILIEHDDSAQNWLTRAKEFLNESPDPRIRYLAVRGLLEHQNSDIQSFLEEYQPDEYDARVYNLIQREIE